MNAAMDKTDIIFAGNPGIGKSTLLSSITGENFPSGVSFCEGLTCKLAWKAASKYPGCRFGDTPGLADVAMQEKAAEAITEALTDAHAKGRTVKIFFVCGLTAGRIRPEDLYTVKTVMTSIKMPDKTSPPANSYGVIFNQCAEIKHPKFETQGWPRIKSLLNTQSASMPFTTESVLAVPLLELLTNADNTRGDFPQVMEFVLNFHGIKLGSVEKIDTEDLEEKLAKMKEQAQKDREEQEREFEKKLAKITEDNRKAQERLVKEQDEKLKAREKQLLEQADAREKAQAERIDKMKEESEKRIRSVEEENRRQAEKIQEESRQREAAADARRAREQAEHKETVRQMEMKSEARIRDLEQNVADQRKKDEEIRAERQRLEKERDEAIKNNRKKQHDQDDEERQTKIEEAARLQTIEAEAAAKKHGLELEARQQIERERAEKNRIAEENRQAIEERRREKKRIDEGLCLQCGGPGYSVSTLGAVLGFGIPMLFGRTYETYVAAGHRCAKHAVP